jgi:riboflavin kinase/FMN adenylyltransferase
MMNIGVRPTVSAGTALTLEVHIFDFEGNLHGEAVAVSFLRRLREERKFRSVEDLAVQLGQDREVSLRLLAGRRK